MRADMKKWRRFSAVILTVALLVSMLATTAMAVSVGDKTSDNVENPAVATPLQVLQQDKMKAAYDGGADHQAWAKVTAHTAAEKAGYTAKSGAVTGDVVDTYSSKADKSGMIYRVMFRFVSLTKDENGQAKELPQSVQDLLPAPITGLKQNDTVAYPLLDKTSVSVADGTWVFTGWPGGTSATITGNILEVGGWRFEAAPKVFSPTMGIMIERQRIDVPAEGPNGSNANLPEMFRPITVTLGTVERSFEADTVGGAGSPLTIRFTNYPDSQFSEGDYPILVDNLPEGYTYELLVNGKAVQSPIRVDDNLSNIMLNIRKTYTLAYDTNGGNADGPAAQSGLLPDAYPLSAAKPTHAPVGGKSVVWIGWTAEQDAAIYERGAASFDPSHLLTTVTISNKDETVYALWGYDENGNGTADVLEQTATITFRIANGTWADGSTAGKQTLILLHEGKGNAGCRQYSHWYESQQRLYRRYLGRAAQYRCGCRDW